MNEPHRFSGKTSQCLSNAPTPKWFGLIFAYINQFEYQRFSLNFIKNLGKFEFFSKNAKMKKFQIELYRWVFVQNASELVRLKALDPYFLILQHLSMYEHVARICEHVRTALLNAIFTVFSTIGRFRAVYRRFKAVYGKTIRFFRKNSSRAFKRTNSEVIWTKTRWDNQFFHMLLVAPICPNWDSKA